MLAGDTEAVTAMRAALDAATTALYRADRLIRIPGAPVEGTARHRVCRAAAPAH